MKTLEEYKTLVFEGAYKKCLQTLDEFEAGISDLAECRPVQLDEYGMYLQDCKELYDKLNAMEGYKASYEDMTSMISADIEDEELGYAESYQDRIDAVFEQVDSLKETIEQDNKMRNQQLREVSQNKNQVYVELEEKRKTLEQYSDRIFDVCASYDIYTSDLTMSTNVFSPQELNVLYDEYLKYMKREMVSGGNPITWFKENFPSLKFQGATILLFVILGLTPLFDIIGIAILIGIVCSQIAQRKRVKYYSVLMGVVFNIKPLEFGYKEFDESELLPEEIDTDTDERFSKFEEEVLAIMNEQDANSPTLKNQKLLQSAELETGVIKVLTYNYNKEIEKRRSELIATLGDLMDEVEDEYNKRIEEVKLLGSKYSESYVLDTNFALGLKDNVFEEFINVGLQNHIINPGPTKAALYRFIRVMWANMLLNVRPGYLTTYVFDPNEFGQVLIPFYNDKMDKTLIFEKNALEDILKNLTAECQNNMKEMKGKDINQYNTESSAVGKTTKEYKLLIIMSQPKKFEEQEALKEFLTYSSKYGIFVWLVTTKMPGAKNTVYWRKPFDGVNTPYPIDEDKFCNQVTETYLLGLKSVKTAALMWQDFVDKAIPDDKVWTGCADEYIELYPGFEGGDPSKFAPYTVGNEGNVHIIGVGGTGAGKSVFLNHLTACVTRLYDPTEVELWMCDFKGTEFKFYLPSEEYPFMLPHIKACLCTSDGDYATSLFHAIRTMADKRYEDLKDAGQKNMVGYNRFCRSKYEETGDKMWLDKKWPRVLFICDEFQVIFEKADAKNLESINADITQLAKVARACGVHIFFTSQSMKKTVSDDILQQFTLRFALRCAEEVSMSVLGTKNASSIKEKNGYLYVRSVEMDLTQQKRYRTPFLPDSDKPGKPSDLRKHIKRMYDRAVETGFKFKDVITYEEATIHPMSELEEYFTKDVVVNGLPEHGGLFFLGNPMVYTENRAPVNVIMNAKNNRHIFSVFNDTTDIVNFYRTILLNIKKNKGGAGILIHSALEDLHYLCHVDETADPKLESLSGPKVDIYTIKAWVEGLLERRKAANSKDKPMYVILLGWDKAQGFGVDADMQFRQEFNILLQTCGEYHIHFIMICSAKGSIAQTISDACNTKICGRCSEDESYMLLGNKQGCKVYDSMRNGYMFINVSGVVTRVKLYRSVITREIVPEEFIVKG